MRLPGTAARAADGFYQDDIGLNAGIIDRTQFSVLITTVILSAIVPTFLAQRFFSPPLSTITTEQVEDIEDEEFEPGVKR